MLSREFDAKTTPPEEQQIAERGQKCVDCDQTNMLTIKLYLQNGGTTGGVPCPTMAYKALQFCSRASMTNLRDEYLVRCHNCQSRFHSSPGRPPKYTTYEERLVARRRQKAAFKEDLRSRALAYYDGGTCLVCDAPADGLHWIGEEGEAPKRSRPWVYAQILADPEFARQYAPYCNSHRPWKHLDLAKRGEVAGTPFWAR